MPQRGNRRARNELRDYLDQLGLAGDYLSLIDAAVRGDWGTQQFVTRLTHTRTFRQSFPGLIERGGTIANGLSGQEGAPITASTLGAAIRNYRTLENRYQTDASRYGYGRVNKRMMAELVKGQVSPDEFANRLRAVRTVNQTPGLKEFFDKALKASGLHGVDTAREAFRLAAGVSGKRFEDIYETARLAQANIGFDIQQGAQLAKQLGQPGEAIDIGDLVTQVRQQLGDIGPELQQAGISNAMLARFLANPKDDTLGLSGKLASIVASRRAKGGFVAGTQLQKGTAGGPTLYEPEQAAAY